MTLDGEQLLQADTSLRLIRLDSCPRVLELPPDGTGWLISSAPPLALVLALGGLSADAGEPNVLPFPFLLVGGSGSEPTGGFDLASAGTFGDGLDSAVGCQSGEEANGIPPSGTVTFDGPETHD